MRRRVTRYAGGDLPVPSYKQNVVQVLYNDYLCVRQFRKHRSDQVLHQARCLVPAEWHTNQCICGARCSHTHCPRHCRGKVHAPLAVAEINLGPPRPPLHRAQQSCEALK